MCDTSTLIWKRGLQRTKYKCRLIWRLNFSEKDEKGAKFPLAHLIAAFPRSYGISIPLRNSTKTQHTQVELGKEVNDSCHPRGISIFRIYGWNGRKQKTLILSFVHSWMSTVITARPEKHRKKSKSEIVLTGELCVNHRRPSLTFKGFGRFEVELRVFYGKSLII